MQDTRLLAPDPSPSTLDASLSAPTSEPNTSLLDPDPSRLAPDASLSAPCLSLWAAQNPSLPADL